MASNPVYLSDGTVYESELHHALGIKKPSEEGESNLSQRAVQAPGDMDVTGNILPSQPLGKVSEDITANLPMSENVEDRRVIDNVKELNEFEKKAEYLKTKTEYRLKDLITSDKLNKELGIDDVVQRIKEARKRSDFRNDQTLKDFKANRRSREYDFKAGNRYE
jgi:hypothetical protein